MPDTFAPINAYDASFPSSNTPSDFPFVNNAPADNHNCLRAANPAHHPLYEQQHSPPLDLESLRLWEALRTELFVDANHLPGDLDFFHSEDDYKGICNGDIRDSLPRGYRDLFHREDDYEGICNAELRDPLQRPQDHFNNWPPMVDGPSMNTMPTVSRKRSRGAASMNDVAGSSRPLKRSRSQSIMGTASCAAPKARKITRKAPVVLLDSDLDVFDVDSSDDNQADLIDMTADDDDNIPEELQIVPERRSTKLSKFECIICLDTASTLTVTHCGTFARSSSTPSPPP